MRDDFSPKVKEVLAKRVQHRCSRPGCFAPTSGPHEQANQAVNLGVAAHITAAASGGPRFDPVLTPAQRSNIENAIWLCQNCAKLIDSDPNRFPAELLQDWKRKAEALAREALEAGAATPGKPELVSVSHLPVTRSDVFGRERELELLDTAWEDPGSHVLEIVAWGGVGKSALVNRWLSTMAVRSYSGARIVFGWSFYSQGATERVASADLFIETALAEFGDPAPTAGSPWNRGERLAKLVRAHRTLLVLDGLEALQFPPGPQEGRLRDRAVAALLTELAAGNTGLCIVTSRVEVADIAVFERGTLRRIDLDALSTEAGVRLLAATGVTPDEPAELRNAVGAFAGHALALTLLGSYLADVYAGDIRRWREVGPLQDDPRIGGHARRVMRAYENWFSEGPELSVLRLLGLFDRPADPGAIRALRDLPAIPGLTDHLPERQRGWQQALTRLRSAALVADPNPADPDSLDTHPLIRDYFGEQLRTRAPGAWRTGNERLYRYFAASAPEFPETLRDMAPLYSAVSHGREAGHPEEAFQDVYNRRIQRGIYFAFRSLGSATIDLACLSRFFESTWDELKPGLEPDTRASIFNQVGVFLRAVGRLPEAIQATEQALALRAARAEWKDAVLNATNLAEMAVLVGDLLRARSAARASIDYADHAGDTLSGVISRSALATVLHQVGDTREALELFADAEAREISRGHGLHFLYSLRGFQYGDLLLDEGRVDEVVERARTTLGWAEERNNLLDMGLGRILLGRAALSRDQAPEALDYILQAMDDLHAADTLHHLVRARLVRARTLRVLGRYSEAERELDLVQRYSSHLGLRLHRTDGELERAWLLYAQGDLEAARAMLLTVDEAVGLMRYGKRRAELATLSRQLNGDL